LKRERYSFEICSFINKSKGDMMKGQYKIPKEIRIERAKKAQKG